MVTCPKCRARNVVLKAGISRCWKCRRVLWVTPKK